MSDPKEESPNPAGPNQRQTRKYLMELLASQGLRPRRQLGQNFLIDLNLQDLLVSSAQVLASDVVLEIGGGTGGLTGRLAAQVLHVLSVEIDPGFFRLLTRAVGRLPNVTLLQADVLDGKNKINAEVLEQLDAVLTQTGAPGYHLVANLPYDVSASVVGNLLLDDRPIRSLTFTVQLEMAERITAAPGTTDFGPLSVLCQQVGTVQWVRKLGSSVFWPRPQIESAILHIDVDPARRTDLPMRRRWHRFVRDLFLHRRKTLRSAIASIPGCKELRPQLDAVFAKLDVQGEVRAEQLSPQILLDLSQAIVALIDGQPTS